MPNDLDRCVPPIPSTGLRHELVLELPYASLREWGITAYRAGKSVSTWDEVLSLLSARLPTLGLMSPISHDWRWPPGYREPLLVLHLRALATEITDLFRELGGEPGWTLKHDVKSASVRISQIVRPSYGESNLQDFKNQWLGRWQDNQVFSQEQIDRATVAAHEAGHALGLPHPPTPVEFPLPPLSWGAIDPAAPDGDRTVVARAELPTGQSAEMEFDIDGIDPDTQARIAALVQAHWSRYLHEYPSQPPQLPRTPEPSSSAEPERPPAVATGKRTIIRPEPAQGPES